MFLLGLLRALASSAQTPMMPSFASADDRPPRSLLGLAVPAPCSPLVRRDKGKRPRDGLVEGGCERVGSVVEFDDSSLPPVNSLDALRTEYEPGIPDEEVMTEIGEVAVVALSMAVSCLTCGSLAQAYSQGFNYPYHHHLPSQQSNSVHSALFQIHS